MKHSDRYVSLDAPTDDEETNLLDVIENHGTPKADEELSHESLQYEIRRTLKGLPDRQRETVCLFFGTGVERPMCLDDIARKFDLNTERVRQIKDKTLVKLKSSQHTNILRGFLGN